MPSLSAGRLNRRITIQSPSTEQDVSGALTTQWNDVVSTWAGIRAATSKEVYASASFVSQLSHVVTIRFNPAVQHGMRISYRGRVFRIQAVSDPDENRVMQSLLCMELNDGQQ